MVQVMCIFVIVAKIINLLR